MARCSERRDTRESSVGARAAAWLGGLARSGAARHVQRSRVRTKAPPPRKLSRYCPTPVLAARRGWPRALRLRPGRTSFDRLWLALCVCCLLLVAPGGAISPAAKAMLRRRHATNAPCSLRTVDALANPYAVCFIESDQGQDKLKRLRVTFGGALFSSAHGAALAPARWHGDVES